MFLDEDKRKQKGVLGVGIERGEVSKGDTTQPIRRNLSTCLCVFKIKRTYCDKTKKFVYERFPQSE